MLKMTEPGPGFMHFPLKYDEEYFNQLTAEKAVTKYSRGFPYRVWVKIRARNEALDCRVYGMAALAILNPIFEKIAETLKEKRWEAKNGEQKKKRPRKTWVNKWKS